MIPNIIAGPNGRTRSAARRLKRPEDLICSVDERPPGAIFRAVPGRPCQRLRLPRPWFHLPMTGLVHPMIRSGGVAQAGTAADMRCLLNMSKLVLSLMLVGLAGFMPALGPPGPPLPAAAEALDRGTAPASRVERPRARSQAGGSQGAAGDRPVTASSRGFSDDPGGRGGNSGARDKPS